MTPPFSGSPQRSSPIRPKITSLKAQLLGRILFRAMKCVVFVVAAVTVSSLILAEILSADLKHCPDVHVTLKDVPISYGLWSGTDKERKELERHTSRTWTSLWVGTSCPLRIRRVTNPRARPVASASIASRTPGVGVSLTRIVSDDRLLPLFKRFRFLQIEVI